MVFKMLSNVEKHRDIRQQRSSHVHKIGCPLSSSKFKCDVATPKMFHTISDVELSSSRALRNAQLKIRYSETIMKAQNHTLLEPGAETDNMGAKIRAAKLAVRSREEFKLKRQRQEAREAAGMAILKMEQSVNVEDNFQVMRDFEALIGISHQSLS